ncbi:MAG: hypothetical protein GY751_18915 [Bacteroidetes bacterium]|nr:hypothetical protein [Bacteroidota bacterium]
MNKTIPVCLFALKMEEGFSGQLFKDNKYAKEKANHPYENNHSRQQHG